jgi:mevalonate kinase
LLGEHAVVHGQPALVAGLDARVTVTISPCEGEGARIAVAGEACDARLDRVAREACVRAGLRDRDGVAIEVAGDLPVAVGLGSSAALSVALVRALAAATGRDLSDHEVAREAHPLECIFHGTPSGVDGAAATFGGLLWFEAGMPPRHEPVRPARSIELAVVLGGSRHDTSRTVGGLRERAAAAPAVYRPVFEAIGALVRAARSAIEQGDLPLLGELMSMDHRLLAACGVSTPELDATVAAACAEGALGAKLTGGGGGGAAIALAEGAVEPLAARLRSRGFSVLETRIEAR